MAYDESPGAGSLYRFGPNGQSEVVLPGVTISNGIAQLPGGTGMYYIDSPTQRVDLLSFEGAVAKREPFVTIPPEVGTPDGMTVDTDGGVWVALWGGGRVQRFDPTGNLTHEVMIPTPQVTACTFGGANGSTLFVTTSQIGSPSGDQFAGAVFVIGTDFEGREEVCLS
jgi:sugar lactone lactonase YvrE